jgi:tetratricopeptide (TPR) repeat protein
MSSTVSNRSGSGHELLERSAALSTLGSSLAVVIDGAQGRLVLVSGEAGVGKTALLQRFCAEQKGAARVFWGACEVLFTPRPLGPLLDIARVTEIGLGQLIASGARPYEVADWLMRELRARAPTILVLEDLHWADEATLDVLRLLSRRLEAVPALVLATYRDDGLDRSHPLRIVLGELAMVTAVDRIGLARLSPAAVAVLAGPHGVDPDELYRRTGGNPFFVTEVLAAGDAQLPGTVRDAVLARTARLSPSAMSLLEAVAVVSKAELWLLGALAGDAVERLDECLASGMLVAEPDGVTFRHELARLAVEESLGPQRRAALHRAALSALLDSGTGRADAPRLAHHAEGAGDARMVLRFAPSAGANAAALGAHREAAAQYARAVRAAEDLPPAARADLFERYAYECYLTGRFDEALDAQQHALACRRAADDRVQEGDCLRSLSRLLRFVGRTTEAADAGRAAVDLLEELPAGHELAMAYANLSHICVTTDDAEGALEWGGRAG